MSSDRTRVMYMIDGLGHGGAERQLYVFLKHLNRERYEPRVCVLSVKQGNVVADQIRALGIEVDLFEAGRLLDPRGNRRLQQYLLSHRPAILHSHLDYAERSGSPTSRPCTRWKRRPGTHGRTGGSACCIAHYVSRVTE